MYDLAAVRAENEAWREKYLPRIRARNEKQKAERKKASELLDLALRPLTEEQRSLVYKVFKGI